MPAEETDILKEQEGIKMVNEIIQKDKKYFQCDICKFHYKTRDWAEKCENFCKKYNSCSLDITKHSVKLKK